MESLPNLESFHAQSSALPHPVLARPPIVAAPSLLLICVLEDLHLLIEFQHPHSPLLPYTEIPDWIGFQ